MKKGNSFNDVIGCIAPGMGRVGPMVSSSRNAMAKIMFWVSNDQAKLIIKDGD